MLGGDKTRVHHDPTRLDREIVIAAAKILAAAFGDSKAPALTAIGRSELVEMDDAVRDAMDCAIDAFRGHVIEQYDGRLVQREIMLEREDLPAIAQRALR